MHCLDALNRMHADPGGLGHPAAIPVGRLAGRFGERHVLSPNRPSTPSRMKRSCHRQTTIFRLPQASASSKNDTGASTMFLRCVAIPNDPMETNVILRHDFNHDTCSHSRSKQQITAFGNLPNASIH
jgi:hypothetical protein